MGGQIQVLTIFFSTASVVKCVGYDQEIVCFSDHEVLCGVFEINNFFFGNGTWHMHVRV